MRTSTSLSLLLILLCAACDDEPALTPAVETAGETAESEEEDGSDEPAEHAESEAESAPTEDARAEVRAFISQVSTTWNAGDQGAYLELFEESLRCFYGTPSVARSQLAERRTAAMMRDTKVHALEVEILSLADGRAVVVEHGVWLARARRSGVHRKAYELVRRGDEWRIAAEVGARRQQAGARCHVELPVQPAAHRMECRREVQRCNAACRSTCSDEGASSCVECRSACSNTLASCVGVTMPEWPTSSPEEIEARAEHLRQFAGRWALLGDVQTGTEAAETEAAAEDEEDLGERTVWVGDGMQDEFLQMSANEFLSRIPVDELNEEDCRNRLVCPECDGMGDGNGSSVCITRCTARAACFVCGNTPSCCSLIHDERQVWPLVEAHTGDSCNDDRPPYLF